MSVKVNWCESVSKLLKKNVIQQVTKFSGKNNIYLTILLTFIGVNIQHISTLFFFYFLNT